MRGGVRWVLGDLALSSAAAEKDGATSFFDPPSKSNRRSFGFGRYAIFAQDDKVDVESCAPILSTQNVARMGQPHSS